MGECFKLCLIILAIMALFSCDSQENNASVSEQAKQSGDDSSESVSPNQIREKAAPAEPVVKLNLPASAFKTVEWTDLMPQADIDALMNPPSYLAEIEDGSEEDQISGQLQGGADGSQFMSALETTSDDAYYQALVSTTVIPELDGQPVRIPGFIAPLEFDDDQTITEFFLVPFFGACIHLPPPPPNQIIYVKYPEGFKINVLYEPFWVSGVLKTSMITNSLATAAYTMQMQSMEPYTEE